jgi:hypothetical protein
MIFLSLFRVLFRIIFNIVKGPGQVILTAGTRRAMPFRGTVGGKQGRPGPKKSSPKNSPQKNQKMSVKGLT